MNSIALDTLFLRRPKLNYVSPPVCEAVFSGTGSPIIILPDIGPLLGPTGIAVGGSGQITLRWNNYPGALCYNVYSAIFTGTVLTDCEKVTSFSLSAQYKLVAECVHGTSFDLTVQGCYRISAITGEGETDLSNPICTACYTPACPFGSIWNPLTFQCETCQFPVCPPGYVPNGVTCGCSPCGAQPCPPGFVVDPGSPCNCVPCGTQTCPEGYVVSLLDHCQCAPTTGPFEVCNEEQTATCTPPDQGDPVTVDAGTFCTSVNTAPEVAPAQAAMNAQALAEAQMLLCCNTLDWNTLHWGSAVATNQGTGMSAFVPQNADSNSFNASSSVAPALLGFANIANIAQLPSYQGFARTIRIDVNSAVVVIDDGLNGGSDGSLFVTINGGPQFIFVDGSPIPFGQFRVRDHGAGIHVLRATLPDGCDTPVDVKIQVAVHSGQINASSINSSITFTGTVSTE